MRRLFILPALLALLAPSFAFAAQGAACSATDQGSCAPGQICDTSAGHCISTTNQQCTAGHPACTDGFTCAATGFCYPGAGNGGTSATNPTKSTTPAASDSSFDKNAQATTDGTLQNPLTASSLPDLLNTILGAVVKIGGVLLVLALVWVGFLFVAAQGSEEKIRDARSALVWTVVGGLILLGAQAISLAVQATAAAL